VRTALARRHAAVALSLTRRWRNLPAVRFGIPMLLTTSAAVTNGKLREVRPPARHTWAAVA
jgi:hypothetical protein